MDWTHWDAWNTSALAQAYRTAEPIAHVAIDSLVSDRALGALRFAVTAEPHTPLHSVTHRVAASAEVATHPVLRRFFARLGSDEVLADIRAVTGEDVATLRAQTWVLEAGDSVAPHRTDARVAAMLALSVPGAGEGGVLILQADSSVGGAVQHDLQSNQLVLIDQTGSARHGISAVTSGSRILIVGYYS
jgi:hypothetical protein